MKSFVAYQLRSLLYSLKWMPPSILYVSWIFSQYYYENLPIADSHSISAFVLYPVIVWLTMVVCNLEKGSEKLILLSYMPKRACFLYGKMIVIFLVGLTLAAVSFVLPLLLGIFGEPLTIERISLFLYGHIVFILLGIFTGSLFSATNMGGKKYSWSGSAFVVCAAIASSKIMDVLPGKWKWIVYILPPVSAVANTIKEGVQAHLPENVWVITYIFVGFLVVRMLFLTREKVN
ncbi:hypothetical protein [Pseudobacillus wudalianchiensis]|uniref:Uncharacterized protein n=1 Tax=Pseudobacillus wudalianchiensis TaxID=1743143 RepID=A0A1B9AU66_9BACI|nr:hypothetical protein [Bacillus wudalianchiensis]OCA87334.1 hypothetical protein A8F95_08815 [Bacillus wudalianchiensis]